MLAITRMLRSALPEHLKACSEMRFCTKCVRWGMDTKFILIRLINKNNFSEIWYISRSLSFLEIIILKNQTQTHKISLIPSHPHSAGLASRLMQPCSIFTLGDSKWKGAFASLHAGCDHTAATALAGTGAEGGLSCGTVSAEGRSQDSPGVGSGSREDGVGHCPSAQHCSVPLGEFWVLLLRLKHSSASIREKATEWEVTVSMSSVKARKYLFSFFNSQYLFLDLWNIRRKSSPENATPAQKWECF